MTSLRTIATGDGNRQARVSWQLATRKGRAVIASSEGRILPWSCYGVSSEWELNSWQQKQRTFLQSGAHLFQIALWHPQGQYWTNQFFSLDGKPVVHPREPLTLGAQAAWLLQQDPAAHFLVRFGIHPDWAWRVGHPDQYVRLAEGCAMAPPDGRSANPSLASDLYIRLLDRNIRDLVAWTERQPWRNRVVGYTIFPYGEGITEVGIGGLLFEASQPMQEAFRRFVQEKYRTDSELQSAWRDPSAMLANILVPTPSQWREKRARLGLLHWPDPAMVQRERDYFLLQKELFRRYCLTMFNAMHEATRERPVIKGYDILKQAMQGWMHNMGFNADARPGALDDYGSMLLATGSFGTDGALLDHPGFDILQTPGMYYQRAMGHAWETEGLSDSLTIRGKCNFMEADMRTWVNRDWYGKPITGAKQAADAGVFLTPREVKAGFDRTLAWALSRNQMFYYMSVCGANWWFDDPAIAEVIQGQVDLIREAGQIPWRETPDVICMVVDDASPLYEDFSSGYQHLAVFRQIEEGLGICGVPYRIHLLSDLKRLSFPEYRCYLFPDLFKMDSEVESLLREKVLCRGHLAVFGPGTGITDGRTLSAEGASRLFGVQMELIPKSCPRRVVLQDHGHPLSRKLPTQIWGDSHAYGPILAPAKQRFGRTDPARALSAAFCFHGLDRPGVFVSDFGRGAVGSGRQGKRGRNDYAVIFTPAVPLPPEFLRECARYAGCCVWCESNSVIYACQGFVAIHSAKSGAFTIHLPQKQRVVDAYTRKLIRNPCREFTVRLSAPATRMFLLE